MLKGNLIFLQVKSMREDLLKGENDKNVLKEKYNILFDTSEMLFETVYKNEFNYIPDLITCCEQLNEIDRGKSVKEVTENYSNMMTKKYIKPHLTQSELDQFDQKMEELKEKYADELADQ